MAAPSFEDALDLIAKWRDQHHCQASDWQKSLEHYSSTGDIRQISESSGMIERNNFAASTLAQLLERGERLLTGGA